MGNCRFIYGAHGDLKYYCDNRFSTCRFEVAKDYGEQRKRGLNPVFRTENVKADLSDVETWGDNPYQFKDKEINQTK